MKMRDLGDPYMGSHYAADGREKLQSGLQQKFSLEILQRSGVHDGGPIKGFPETIRTSRK